MSDRILTPKFRGSYVHVITPRKPKDGEGEAKFGATIVLPKDSPKTAPFIAKLKALFKAAMMEKFGKVLPDAALKHYPIRDGDEYLDDNGDVRPEFEGAWVIGAKNSRQVGLCLLNEDGTREELDSETRAIHAEKFYSGAYYYASVSAYAWSNPKGGKGISVSLSSLLWVADGERFGGGGYDASDFDGVAAGGSEKPAGKKTKSPPVDDDEPPL